MNSQSKSKEEALQRIRQNSDSAEELWEGILQRNKVALGKAVSYIESQQSAHQKIAEQIITLAVRHSRENCRKIGITGVPGVGKSTFINQYTQLLLKEQQSIAILTIDPSSKQSGGSILGDKTRMTEIFSDPNVFIRPSPSGLYLGGVAQKTREVMLLCEAAGFDNIIVETVGVGQSETHVYNMTDVFLLLLLPGAGDELQGIKRGIMEMADILIVHKADGDNLSKAKLACAEYKRALHLFPPNPSGWTPSVLMASSIPPQGIEEVKTKVESYFLKMISSGYLMEKRKVQRGQWFDESLEDQWMHLIKTHPLLEEKYKILKAQVNSQEISPNIAASRIIEFFQIHEKP